MIAEAKRRGLWQAPAACGSADALPGAEYRPHAPTEQQSKFLELGCLEALFGGAAGGGKSDALLMDALQYVHVPGYAALLLRRTYADLSLPGALMDRARDWWSPTPAKWRDNEKTWEFPSGATITFGYLETERNKYRYQGAEFQYVGFDELTQFSETQYRYLLSRLRRLKGSEVPLRMRGATNPGGVGHEWVKTRFGLGHGSDGEPLTCPDGRVFIPAKLEDNPHLDREEYEKSLAELDPVTRAQLRSGNWDVLPEGVMFQRGWFEIVEAAPALLRCVRYWDLAATEAKAGSDPDWTVGLKLGVDAEGTYYVLDVRRERGTPQAVQRLVSSTAALDGRAVPIWMEEEGGSSGKTVIDHYTRKVLSGYTFRGIKSTGDKVTRAAPVSSQAEAGNIKLLRGNWLLPFLDEVGAFPTAGVHDDQVDALSGALAMLSSKNTAIPTFGALTRQTQ